MTSRIILATGVSAEENRFVRAASIWRRIAEAEDMVMYSPYVRLKDMGSANVMRLDFEACST
jgi:hypothetical protein